MQLRVFLALAFFFAFASAGGQHHQRSKPAVLYIWCGQNTSLPNAKDFVAVVDFDPQSPLYGKVVRTVSLPSNVATLSASGNEAHHAQVSADYKYYVTGGLLSFLQAKDEIFIWKVPQKPILGPLFSHSLNPPGACTDEFVPIGGSRFLVSQMCDEAAGSPGNIVIIDAKYRNFSSFIANISEFQNFNPHGFGRAPDGSLTVTNYILPSSLLGSSAADLVFRDTVMVISPTGHLQETFTLPAVPAKTAGVGTGNGFMDFKYIPGDAYNRGYVCGTNDNQMYLLRQGHAPLFVWDFSYLSGRADGHGGLSAGIVSYSEDGTRMVMSLLMKWVVLMDISDPEHPFVLRHFGWCNATEILHKTFPIGGRRQTFSQLCASGSLPATHYVLWPRGEKRFVVLNYFLQFGLAQFGGARTAHAFKFNEDFTDFSYDHEFNPNEKLAQLSASPHAVTYFPVDERGNLDPPSSSSSSSSSGGHH